MSQSNGKAAKAMNSFKDRMFRREQQEIIPDEEEHCPLIICERRYKLTRMLLKFYTATSENAMRPIHARSKPSSIANSATYIRLETTEERSALMAVAKAVVGLKAKRAKRINSMSPCKVYDVSSIRLTLSC